MNLINGVRRNAFCDKVETVNDQLAHGWNLKRRREPYCQMPDFFAQAKFSSLKHGVIPPKPPHAVQNSLQGIVLGGKTLRFLDGTEHIQKELFFVAWQSVKAAGQPLVIF